MIFNIYKITNLQNNKIYIGQTKRDIMKRYADHISHAFTSKRKNDLACPLYIAMKEFGISSFTIDLLESVDGDIKQADAKEKYWIEFYNATDPNIGYNVDKGGHYISEKCRKAVEEYYKTHSHLQTEKQLTTLQQNAIKLSKVVLQLDKYTGEVIKEYPSIIAASRETGFDRRSIQRQLTGETTLNTKRGFSNAKYIWKLKDQSNLIESN